MNTDNEYVVHRDYSNDNSAKIHHCDADNFWTVECYDERVSYAMLEAGATELPSRCDGRFFKVDAKQLILFIAETSGVNVEFLSRKRQQLTAEQIEARRLRMVALNAAQRSKKL